MKDYSRDLSNVWVDRSFHQSSPESEQAVGDEQGGQVPGVVHQDPCDEGGDVHQKRCLLSA